MYARNAHIPVRVCFLCDHCEELHEAEGEVTHIIQDSNTNPEALDDGENIIMFVVQHGGAGEHIDDRSVVNIFTLAEMLDIAKVPLPVINLHGMKVDTQWVEFGDDRVGETYLPEEQCIDCEARELLDPEAHALKQWADEVHGVYVRHGDQETLVALTSEGYEYVEPDMVEGEPMRFIAGHNPAGSVLVPNAENDMWICKCDCGNQISVSRADLESGKTTSCGLCDAETT